MDYCAQLCTRALSSVDVCIYLDYLTSWTVRASRLCRQHSPRELLELAGMSQPQATPLEPHQPTPAYDDQDSTETDTDTDTYNISQTGR